jgi:hypothetical protein
MKATTKKILSALALADSGEIIGLPLDSDLYPDASIEAAAEAFREHCLVLKNVDSGGLDLRVRPEHRSESELVIGAFLNYLLCDALSRQGR